MFRSCRLYGLFQLHALSAQAVNIIHEDERIVHHDSGEGNDTKQGKDAEGLEGYEVPEDVYNSACEYIERTLKRHVDRNDSTRFGLSNYDFSYAVYVLSMAGKKPLGWIQRLAERSDQLDMAGKVHLAGSYLHIGRRKDALKTLSKLSALPGFQSQRKEVRKKTSSVKDETPG